MTTTVHKNLAVLARVLERLERSPVPVDAEQYRAVVNHLAAELAGLPHDAGIRALLEQFPAAAELYENLHDGDGGLCCSPLDTALSAELHARCLISAARASSAQMRR